MGNIGIDIIEIGRIEGAVLTWGERFLQRIFTPDEIAAYSSKIASLAARFAAKEAVMKLLGKRVSWQDIEVLTNSNGEPLVNLRGQAARQVGPINISTINLSLSHCREYALAVAIRELPEQGHTK